MRRLAEHMNRNFALPSFGVIVLSTVNIAISTMYSCPLCKLKTVQDIMKFLANVKHHETTCSPQKTELWMTYLWSCSPLNIVGIENSYFHYVLVSPLYYYEISHKCKAPWDNLQNTKTVTLVNLLLDMQPLNIVDIENSHFY